MKELKQDDKSKLKLQKQFTLAKMDFVRNFNISTK